MKIFKLFLSSFLLQFFFFNTQVLSETPHSQNNKSFAIIELYTSEGCSSCPPADTILQNLNLVAKKNNLRIFPLSFHVDYWNYLGWTDPYSNNDFSQRQRSYGKVFKKNSVYTPQMIINGQYQFGGYDSKKAQYFIDQALRSPPVTQINLNLESSTAASMTLNYKISNVQKNYIIHFAIVESNLISHVTSGENRGLALKHTNVVRNFNSLVLSKKEGKITLPIKNSWNTNNIEIISYIQDNTTMKILGANSIQL